MTLADVGARVPMYNVQEEEAPLPLLFPLPPFWLWLISSSWPLQRRRGKIAASPEGEEKNNK